MGRVSQRQEMDITILLEVISFSGLRILPVCPLLVQMSMYMQLGNT